MDSWSWNVGYSKWSWNGGRFHGFHPVPPLILFDYSPQRERLENGIGTSQETTFLYDETMTLKTLDTAGQLLFISTSEKCPPGLARFNPVCQRLANSSRTLSSSFAGMSTMDSGCEGKTLE
jgi:hypothetical protein